MELQIIQNNEQYEEAISFITSLMESEPIAGSQESNTLEILALLIEKYEEENSQLDDLDPIDAIKFSMDQKNLKNKDLTPFLGSVSKVSEVLNGKRSLSLKMIRSLHANLGIPYESLMKAEAIPEELNINWLNFPLAEMLSRGLFNETEKLSEIKEYAEEYIRGFLGERGDNINAVLHRVSSRSGREMDKYALMIWYTLALKEATQMSINTDFDEQKLDGDFFEGLAQLSTYESGPLLAKEYLAKFGIRLVFIPHFRKTYLDGAVLKLDNAGPVVALTLRHNRLDNFWFVLMHELAHVKLHLYQEGLEAIYDDLDVGDQNNQIEKEADDKATSVLVTPKIWSVISDATTSRELIDAGIQFARSAAILAGNLRKESGNYKSFNRLIKKLPEGMIGEWNIK